MRPAQAANPLPLAAAARCNCPLAAPQGPFTYEALPPDQISFVPLKETREFKASDLMQVGAAARRWPSGLRTRYPVRP